MKTTRQGLMGNFVSLHEVVKAVADRIAISDEEADRRRPNRLRGESAFQAQIARSQIKNVMAMSRAAGVLLEPLDRPPAQRPAWYDSSRGYAKWKDGVCDRGVDILIDLSRTETSLLRKDRCDQQLESAESGGELLPAHSIGFEIEELIAHLESTKVPHSLTLRASPEHASFGFKSAPLMAGSVTSHWAPQDLVDLKESESLTVYLSRTLPPPSVPPEQIHEPLLATQLVSSNDDGMGDSNADDALQDEESSVDRERQVHSIGASLVTEATLQAVWLRFERWARKKRSSPAQPIVLKVLNSFEPQDRRHFSVYDVQKAIKELYLNGTDDELRSVEGSGGEWQFVVGTNTGTAICKHKALVDMLRRWQEKHDLLLEGLVSELSKR